MKVQNKEVSRLMCYDNGTAHFKNVNNCLNAKFYSYLETSGGKSYNIHLNIVHFFNTDVIYAYVAGQDSYFPALVSVIS
jgi:hypothetical protein